MSSPPSLNVTRRSNTWRATSWASSPRLASNPSARFANVPDTPPSCSYVAESMRPAAMVEELGERVLEQRQRPGAVGHVPHQGGDERRLEADPVRLRRAGDRPLQVARRHRCDDLGPFAEQLADASMLQRPIVEVGAQGDHDTDPALLVGDGTHHVGEEARGDRRIDLRVQLLELVDHEHQLRFVVRQDPADRTVEPLSPASCSSKAGGGSGTCISNLELLEWMGPGSSSS